MLLITSSPHIRGVCVLVVALCGFLCSTHPKQPAPTPQPDAIACWLNIKEQLLVHNVWITFQFSRAIGELFRHDKRFNLTTCVYLCLNPFYNYLYLLSVTMFSSWLNLSVPLQTRSRLQTSQYTLFISGQYEM